MKTTIQNFVLLSLFLMISLASDAKNKVVKTSGKQPEWAEKLVATDHVIGIAKGATVEEAKEKAFVNVRKQISESVAVNVMSKSVSTMHSKSTGNSSQTESEYKSFIESQTGDLGLLNDISTSRIKDVYWELIRNKDTGEEFYSYWVKYPFTAIDRMKMVDQFMERDREATESMNKQLNALDSYNTIEDIESSIKALKTMLPKFYGVRKSKTEVGIEKGKNLLESVNIVTKDLSKDQVRFELLIGDKTVTTSKVPKIRSKCFQVLNIDNKNGETLVTFNDDDCFEEENYMEVSYKLYTGIKKKKVAINLHAYDIELKLFGQITMLPKDGKIKILVNSTYKAPVVVTSLELNDAAADFNLILDDLNIKVEGAEQHTLNISTKPFELKGETNKVELNGYLKYQNAEGSEKKVIRVYRREAKVIN